MKLLVLMVSKESSGSEVLDDILSSAFFIASAAIEAVLISL